MSGLAHPDRSTNELTGSSASLPLPPGQQLAAPGKWPVVGERAPADGPATWTVRLSGLVERPASWTLEQLTALPQVERAIDVHCVTRWSRPGMRFRGVPLSHLLEICGPLPAAQYISFTARSLRPHATSLPLADCRELDVLVALEAEGHPLSAEHGGPIRTVTPGRYFYKSLKWLERIELLAADRLGYWEAQAGYHNGADPWLQQRYMASTLDKHKAARLIASRDFRNENLLSIDAHSRDLQGLQAQGALLRDADFRGADLRNAIFDHANLTNAHLQHADLRGASLRGADLEGASLEGADLRDADLTGASLLGATFLGDDSTTALIDVSTRLDAASCEQLMPAQAEFLRARRPGLHV